jgi:hypothetical protein
MAKETLFRAGMGMVMIWDGSHVVINSHFEREKLGHDLCQSFVKARLDIFTGESVVFAPNNHGH